MNLRLTLPILSLAIASTTAMAQWNADSTEYESFDRYRLGGYGEMVASFKNYGTNRFNGTSQGNTHMHRGTIAIPRFTIASDVKFSRHWVLSTEMEFEAGGVGSALEIENTENGEYETEVEKGGEVALEQFHLTYHLNSYFNLRVGHMVLPVGQTNRYHEPLNYFGTVRPEGESSLLPATWHETGLEVFGNFGRRWASMQYNAFVTAGLNANGFDRNHWVQGGKQGLFEQDNFTSPALVGRLSYTGVPGLTLGTTFYYLANAAANSDKPQDYAFRVPVRIWSLDARYRNSWAEARANLLCGNLTNSVALSNKNVKLSNASPYTRTTPIAHRTICYGFEAGLRLKHFVRSSHMPDLVPFARYEYYDAQHRVDAPKVADTRLQTDVWVAGINYRPLPYLIVKADYTKRRIGGGAFRSENEFALGVAFANWFVTDRTVRDHKARRQIVDQQQTIRELNARLESLERRLDGESH